MAAEAKSQKYRSDLIDYCSFNNFIYYCSLNQLGGIGCAVLIELDNLLVHICLAAEADPLNFPPRGLRLGNQRLCYVQLCVVLGI